MHDGMSWDYPWDHDAQAQMLCPMVDPSRSSHIGAVEGIASCLDLARSSTSSAVVVEQSIMAVANCRRIEVFADIVAYSGLSFLVG